ncbi:LacI family DNA-binding transcriptional regulator [Novosphingobium rosa]|uniref:LacI family DNA-binding transcriptional regulator n=1 Tax=Novosphingobium rosa TaxID=76978 RepID=UPI000834B1D2|nr:LacI family DNA-binding transcriptional regulator [Novosphingobium rosa]
MATIKDVSEKSGISVKTISRVLNGVETVRPNVRAKVEAAIRELNYRPALAARQLVSGKTYIIVILVPDVAAWYYSRMLLAMAQACRAVGWHLVVEVFDRQALEVDADWAISLSCNADAVIVLPPWSDHPKMLRSLERLGLPTVRIAAQARGFGKVVDVHQRAAMAELVAHLIAQGHERIAMIAPPAAHFASEQRHLGYRDAMAAAGLEAPPAYLFRSAMTFESGQEAFGHLMALPQRPTAIVAVNDATALGAMTAALRLGFRVPQDLAFTGFDNSSESRSAFPPLTTVEPPFEQIARAAVLMAIDREEASGDPVRPPDSPRIILRESTEGAPV